MSDGGKEERTELAEERTQWADQRTYLAQERTFAGWIRTGLNSIAVGIGVVELLREVEPQWLISGVGVVLISIGGFLQLLAYSSFRNVNVQMRETEQPDMSIQMWKIALVTGALVLTAVGGLVVVFFGGPAA